MGDVARWVCPLCGRGVAEPVVDGWGQCFCSDARQRLIDVLEPIEPGALANELERCLQPGARIKDTPMVPLHARTIRLIVMALHEATQDMRPELEERVAGTLSNIEVSFGRPIKLGQALSADELLKLSRAVIPIIVEEAATYVEAMAKEHWDRMIPARRLLEVATAIRTLAKGREI